MKKKINWQMISNIAVCIALLSVVIGFYVVINNLTYMEKRLQKLELDCSLIEQDYNQLRELQ